MSPQIGKHRFLHTVNQAVCGAVHNLELANLGAQAPLFAAEYLQQIAAPNSEISGVLQSLQ
jgi:hypothetical protein